MSSSSRSLIELHIAVLLFGLSGLFGKLLSLDPSQIVLGRTVIGATTVCIWLIATGQLRKAFVPGQWLTNLLLGALLSLHWMSFFHAIQVSSVAIGLLAFASFPVFVTLLEPLLFKERWRSLDLLTTIIVVTGLYLVVPLTDSPASALQGLAWGIFSALLFAILSLSNRSRVKKTDTVSLSFLQNTGAALTAILFVTTGAGLEGMTQEIPLLLILGVCCTTLPVMLYLNSLKHIKAQLVSIVICLEPVYGILLAIPLLDEIPSLREVSGGLVIISAIAIASVMREKT